MKHLRTSRVVVIDDDIAEATPVLEALGRLGIGCAFFRGTRIEDLPDSPLDGIRLAFVDMELDNQGSSRQIGAHTAKVFSTIISASETPMILVLWTKHLDHVEAFKEALFDSEPRFRPMLLITKMEKPDRAAEIVPNTVFQDVKSIIADHPPMDFLWLWEQLTHSATTETTKSLCQVVGDRTSQSHDPADGDYFDNWLLELGRVLWHLAKAAAGKNTATDRAGIDVLEVLVAMHQDSLDREAITRISPNALTLLSDDPESSEKEEQVAINSMLLVAPHHEQHDANRPGSLLRSQPELGNDCVLRRCGVDPLALGSEILTFKNDAAYKTLSNKLRQHNAEDMSGVVDGLKAELNERAAGIVNDCVPVLLECSPACDYAQRNQQVLRFLAGVLVPDEFEKCIEKKGSLRRLECVNLPNPKGTWHPVFSSRFVYSLPHEALSSEVKPLCRLRSGPLLDLIHWCSTQGSRPGYMSLR